MKNLFLALMTCTLLALPKFQADDLVPGYWERSPLPQTGLATFYAPGMMQYVQGYRETQGQLPVCAECVGMVALLRAGDIGRRVWLQPPSSERVGPFLVIDCAHREDIALLQTRGWVVDVSFEVGQLWNMEGPLEGVTVLADPADDLGGELLRPPTPFRVGQGQIVISTPTPRPALALTPPTVWPTRLPAPLGAVANPPGLPLTPEGVPLPTPLTPVITTPTPRSNPAATAAAATRGHAAAVAGPTSSSPQPDAAVGRPGGMLIDVRDSQQAVPTLTQTGVQPAPSSALEPSRSGPSPTSAPILPASVSPAPAASSEPDLSLWDRLWRALLRLLLP